MVLLSEAFQIAAIDDGPPVVIVVNGARGGQGGKGDPGSPGEGYATRPEIAALVATNLDDAYLTEAPRAGKFVYSNANLSAAVAADTQQAVYLASAASPTGVAGAWVREGNDVTLRHSGADATGVANISTHLSELILLGQLYQRRARVPKGDYRIGTAVSVGAGFFDLEGDGVLSNLVVAAGLTGLTYNDTVGGTGGLWDEKIPKSLRHLRFSGDGAHPVARNVDGTFAEAAGTTTGLSVRASNFHAQHLTFDRHAVGFVQSNTYSQVSGPNFHHSNVVGKKFFSVTAHQENGSYFRFNRDAAVLIDGACQNIVFNGGVIEGNLNAQAVRITATNNAECRPVWNSTYFEANGNKAAGIPGFLNESDAILEFNNCVISRLLIAGIYDGYWKLGPEAHFRNGRLSVTVEVDRVSLTGGISLAGAAFNTHGLENSYTLEPAVLLDWDVSTFDNGVDGYAGYIFQLESELGKSSRKTQITNRAPAAHPYVTAVGAVAPVLSADATLDYGDGSWTRAAYAAEAGAWAYNSVHLNPQTVSADRYRVEVLLVRSNTDTDLVFLQTGDAQSATGKFNLKAGKTYKMLTIGARVIGGWTFLGVYPVGADGPSVAFLPLYSVSFSDVHEASAFIKSVVRGAL
jgi:hypothetical protein